jgi:hypothetical protein
MEPPMEPPMEQGDRATLIVVVRKEKGLILSGSGEVSALPVPSLTVRAHWHLKEAPLGDW